MATNRVAVLRCKLYVLAAIVSVCAVFFVFVPSGECAQAAQPLAVVHTQKHVKLFDIPVEFVPAAGCKFEKTKGGVADAKKKFTAEAVYYSVPFDEFRDKISENVKNMRGISVKSLTKCIYNGKDALIGKIVCVQGKTKIGRWVLAASEGEGTWTFSVSYNPKDKTASQTALYMLKSARWDDESSAASVPPKGTVDTFDTPFKIAAVRCDSLVFTKDGKLPTETADKAIFVASEETCVSVTASMREEYAMERFAAINPTALLDIASVTHGNICGCSEVTIVAFVGEEGSDIIYQTLIFENSSVTALVGMSKGNAAENMQYFYKLAASYSLR